MDKIWVNQTCMAKVLLKAFAVKISTLSFLLVCISSLFLESYALHFIITDLRNYDNILTLYFWFMMLYAYRVSTKVGGRV